MSALHGKRIINTRAVHQAAALDSLLKARGAQPLSYPCIAIVPPEDISPLDKALAAGRYDWLVLTSANTVLMLAERLQALGLSLPSLSVAAVGTSTAQAAQSLLGVTVDLMPETFIAEALADALHLQPGMRVLLPESAVARPTLAQLLRAQGAVVDVVTAYRTVRGSGGVDVPSLLALRQIDAVTFTSSSTVEHFLKRLETEGSRADDLNGVCIACIGTQTEQTAITCGLNVSVVASPHTLVAMVAGLERYFEKG